jgi:hypothetical protein
VEIHAQLASRPVWPWPPPPFEPEIGADCAVTAALYGVDGGILAGRTVKTNQKITRVELPLALCEPWTPDSPVCYRLSVSMDDGTGPSERSVTYGYKPRGLAPLNAVPYTWPLWLRGGAESCGDAYDAGHFERTVIRPLKDSGGNTIYFKKALPPERFLDACDRAGVMAGLEFPYFRTGNPIEESKAAQGRWFHDHALSHPCVCFTDLWEVTQ